MFRRAPLCRFLWDQNITHLLRDVPVGHVVDGHFVAPAGGLTLHSEHCLLASSPSDEVSLMPVASLRDPSSTFSSVLCSSQKAAVAWSSIPIERRQAMLAEVRQELHWRRSTLCTTLSLCSGLPFRYSRDECDAALAGDEKALPSTPEPDSDRPGAVVFLRNGPLCSFADVWRALQTLLLQGNVVVWNPPTVSPLAAQVVGAAFAASAVPPGVLNILHGDVDLKSEGQSASPRVVHVGAAVAPQVLLLRAHAGQSDITRLVSGLARTAGQTNASPRSVFVPRTAWLDFVTELCSALASLSLGHALDPQVDMGPLLDGATLDAALSAVRNAEIHGARLAIGGYRATFPRGYFVAPTVLTVGSSTGMNRSFWKLLAATPGPIIVVQPYTDVVTDAQMLHPMLMDPLPPFAVTLRTNDDVRGLVGDDDVRGLVGDDDVRGLVGDAARITVRAW